MTTAWGVTDRGCVRRENQDAFAYAVLSDQTWGVVCDGMGGAKAGDVASRLAVEAFRENMEREEAPPGSEVEHLLTESVDRANFAVFRQSLLDILCSGMGTTLVGFILRDRDLWTVNVGDSRAYHITADSIERITKDHSVVEELVERGEITREEARTHPRRNLITRALGTGRSVESDLYHRQVEEGHCVLLCSDGLINELTEEEIHELILRGGSAEEIGTRLLRRALERGATDNVTLVLIQV